MKRPLLVVCNNYPQDLLDQLEDCLRGLKQSFTILQSSNSMEPAELVQYKGCILTGGPWDLAEPVLFGEFKLDVQVMINADMPIYGICMGHQIMSESNGAEIGEWSEQYKGWREIEILAPEDPLLKGLTNPVKMMLWHTEWVVAAPPGFELIASCKEPGAALVQGIRHQSKPFWGTQFHPELSGPIGEIVFKNFVEICDNYDNESKLSV